MDLQNPLYYVEFYGGPVDGRRLFIALQETSEILRLIDPGTGDEATYEWQEGTYDPYLYNYREDV